MKEKTTYRVKMVCPRANKCKKKPIWVKPEWDNSGKKIGSKAVFQGHCVPHHEMTTCATESNTCPACIPA